MSRASLVPSLSPGLPRAARVLHTRQTAARARRPLSPVNSSNSVRQFLKPFLRQARLHTPSVPVSGGACLARPVNSSPRRVSPSPSVPVVWRLCLTRARSSRPIRSLCADARRPGPGGVRSERAPRSSLPMILTQVHLRKPCYDFYFLEVIKFVSLSAARRDARGRRVPRAVREPH